VLANEYSQRAWFNIVLIVVHRKGIYRRFSKCDWDSAYESNKHKADIERRHGQMCRADASGTIRLTDGAKMVQCANTKLLGRCRHVCDNMRREPLKAL